MATTRMSIPQAFVSSYAPRIRTFANSLLSSVQPATVIPPVRTTKRGTTAINYSEEFENDDILDDSDAPRRTARMRRAQEDAAAGKGTQTNQQYDELTEPIDMQAIWREWMGKPKRSLTDRQVQVQAELPLHLVPIRIDLAIAPYVPEPALPKPHNAREMGYDENHIAYRQPEATPEFRLKDYFLWNLHEALTTPDQFAKVLVEEMDFPTERKQALIMSISQQIRAQLEEHADVELHPFFVKNKPQPATAVAPPLRPALSRDQSSTPLRGTPLTSALTNGVHSSRPETPLPNQSSIVAVAEPFDTIFNPDDAHRCIVTISLNLQNRLFTDKFEWSILHPVGLPELFAKQTCADLGLSGEWVPALAHSIYEAVLKIKKEVVDNNGSVLGAIGSGVDAYGDLENEAAQVHGDATPSANEGAGWRFDETGLGVQWEPRIEALSKDEIEKREGDRERQLRRMRRDMAVRAGPQLSQRESFYGGPGDDEERMGRGERAKKKRRFRSLSPAGRDTPDLSGAFGGEAGRLSDAERQFWRCNHCQVWGGAVWSVRDGPTGPRTLCHNCGYLFEQDKSLPPWSKDLFQLERDAGTVRPAPPTATRAPSTPAPDYLPVIQPQQTASLSSAYRDSPVMNTQSRETKSHFVPVPTRALSQTFYKHTPVYTGATIVPAPQALPEQYAATVRGGGPQMFEDYAIQGEDLDWTKVTDPRERKRLQNIINGRKYRERRLAMEDGGVGGGSGAEGSQSPALGSSAGMDIDGDTGVFDADAVAPAIEIGDAPGSVEASHSTPT